MLRHLNSATNSGWLAEEDVWVDPEKVKNFGSTPGINLEYKSGKQKPERIFPMALSQGHAQVAADSAESIKAQLGINADLLAASQGGTDSGRAIALRQKQGLLMVQELFDNLSRTRQRAGRFLLSQLGEIYDVETAKKVMGDAWLRKNFPVVMLSNTEDPMAPPEPMKDQFGKPMEYDKDLADLAITEVLGGELETYDVYVGEAVASETQKMSISAEMKDFSTAFPGMIPPDVMIRHSQLPESAKTEILAANEKAMMAQQQMAAQQTQGEGRSKANSPLDSKEKHMANNKKTDWKDLMGTTVAVEETIVAVPATAPLAPEPKPAVFTEKVRAPLTEAERIAESRKSLDTVLLPSQKFFESPEGYIVIGEADKGSIWCRQANRGKGMEINPRR